MLRFPICNRRFGISSLMFFFEESIVERYQRLQKQPEDTFGLPWTFIGETEKPANFRFASEQMLIKHKIPKPVLVNELYKLYEKVLRAIAEDKLPEIQDLLEAKLYQHLEKALTDLKQSGKRLEVQKAVFFPDETGKPTVNVIDSVLYRGLSINRSENPPMESFHVSTDPDLGILLFTHKDLSDRLAYVNQVRIEELHAKNRQTIFQLMLWVKSPLMLKVFSGNEEISKYDENYTFIQQWILESQCIQPPWMKNENKAESYLEWMTKFKPEKWIVTGMNDFFNSLARFTSK